MKKTAFIPILMVAVFLLGLVEIAGAASVQIHSTVPSGIFSQSDAYAEDTADADDPSAAAIFSSNNTTTFQSASAPLGGAQGFGQGAGYYAIPAANRVDLHLEGHAEATVDGTIGVNADIYGGAGGLQPAVTNGLFFEILPDAGESAGDPVWVSYQVIFDATNSFVGSGNAGFSFEGGFPNAPAITLNDTPPVGGPYNPANERWTTGLGGWKISGPLSLNESGSFAAQIGDVVGLFFAVEAWVLSDDPAPGFSGSGDTILDVHIEVGALAYYVDINTGSDVTGVGSEGNPWETLHYAISQINLLPSGSYTLFVAPGIYSDGNGEAAGEVNITQDFLTVQGDPAGGTVVDGFNGVSWSAGFTCTANNVTFSYLEIMTFSNGIDITGGSGSIIDSCTIHDNSDDGIYIENSSPTISRNTIFDNGQNGIQVYSGSGTINPIIEKNIIYDNPTGIYIEADGTGIVSPDITNNLIYESGSGGMLRGIEIKTGGNGEAEPTIYHNTLDGRGVSDFGIDIFEDGFELPDPIIKYNIIANFSQYGVYKDPGLPISTIEYNNVDNNTLGDYGGVISDQTGSNGNISQDPLFLGGGDYHLDVSTPSPCFDVIPPTAGDPVSDDLDNNPRPVPAGADSDMGCYEMASKRGALIDLYNSTNGDSWASNFPPPEVEWWKEPPTESDGFATIGTECSFWYGITCDGLDNVFTIDLSDNNLTGSLPETIGSFAYLTVLNVEDGPSVFGNDLTGPIPPTLGNLTNLQVLYIRDNNFSGPIPATLGNLSNLTDLNLSNNNNLTGPIPPELGNLSSNLTRLETRRNQLSGPIPPELGALTSLTFLDLSENQLSGPIPPQLGNPLSSLQSLYLDRNELSGSIPPELGNLSTLTNNLTLWDNNLTGSIPPQLGQLTTLKNLLLHNNQLSGPIPPELGDLIGLTDNLFLWRNWLSGPIPAELGQLTSLRNFDVSRNALSGPIPPQLGNMSSLETMNLAGNQLSGEVPAALQSLPLDPVASDFRYNALYSTAPLVIAFLEDAQMGGDWQSTQTIAPDNLATGATTASEVDVTWDMILYTGDAGGYEVFYSDTPGGPYTLFETTADKTINNTTVSGLLPDTDYYFVLRAVTYTNAVNPFTVRSEFTGEVSATTSPASAQVYVNWDASLPPDGTSWDSGWTTIQEGIDDAELSGKQVWVRWGTYNETIVLRDGVDLYGGFDLLDTTLGDRDWVTNVTTIDASFEATPNHAVTGDSNAALDGFTITGGDANGLSDPLNRGGGMYNNGVSNLTVANCTFSGNFAAERGGGMYNGSGSSLTITDCVFDGNMTTLALSWGGGIYNDGSSPTILFCTFSGNTAGDTGGGINNFISSPTITNCLFSGNSADNKGGGIDNSFSSDSILTNCTFSGNTAVNSGGAMHTNNASPTITNCILWGDSAPSDSEVHCEGSALPTFSFCDIQGCGGSGSPWWVTVAPGPADGGGNIDDDPLFVGGGDYHLQTSPTPSPCIDVGTNTPPAPGLPATDFEGDSRIINVTVDMGIDEATLTNYTLTVSVSPLGSGSVSLNPPGGVYAPAAVVTLTANPASGYEFSQWTGSLGGSANQDTITMDANKNVTAVFNVLPPPPAANLPPVLNPIGDKSVNEGSLLAFNVSGSDPDDDPLSFSASGLPAGASFSGQTFSWQPDYSQAGTHTVTFSVNDGEFTDSETITITVINVNRPPVLDPIGDKIANENELLEFEVSATDPEGDALEFLVENLPQGASFNGFRVGQTFSWTPGYDQAGTYEVTFSVTDGEGTDSETITITVGNVTDPPVLTPIGDKTVNEGQLLTFAVAATDPDGDPLTYGADGIPQGASFSGQTFSWTPDYTQAGTYQVTFSVSDGVATVSEEITITVTDNSAPQMAPIGTIQGNEGDLISFQVNATDPDGDTLTYAAFNLPQGAVFNAQTRMFEWTPAIGQAGNYQVECRVSDGEFTVNEIVAIEVAISVPEVPELPGGGTEFSPVAGSTGNSPTDIVFSWPEAPYAQTYTLIICADPACSVIVLEVRGLTEPHYRYGDPAPFVSGEGLSPYEAYYMSVTANNMHGEVPYPTVGFATGPPPAGGGGNGGNGGGNGGNGEPSDGSVTLTSPPFIPYADVVYQMISIPLRAENQHPFAILGDDLGAYNRSVWRLFRYDSSDGQYHEYPDVPAMEPGYAYWLIADEQVELDAEGWPVSTEEDFVITIPPGFFQLGCPFYFPVGWESVKVRSGSVTVLIGDPANEWISPFLQKHEDEGYVLTDVLEPWKGRWVENVSNVEVELLIPPIMYGGGLLTDRINQGIGENPSSSQILDAQ